MPVTRTGKIVSTARESRKRRRTHSRGESFIERQYRNVVVGSCLLESFALRRGRSLAGNMVKRHKAGRVPWDKVPSLENCLGESPVVDGDRVS